MSTKDTSLHNRRHSRLDKVYSVVDVVEHNKRSDAWVIVNNIVYDVTHFIDEHPGGASLLDDCLGTDISSTLVSNSVHKHSDAAYSMLRSYKIGVTQQPSSNQGHVSNLIDYSLPLMRQVGMLGKEYANWVQNEPMHFKEPIRLFDNNILELLSGAPWYAPLMYWFPISMCFLCYGLFVASPFQSLVTTSLFTGIMIVMGFVAWCFGEYIIHKYMFHWDRLASVGSYTTNVMHFSMHGIHHKIPMDRYRLVAPILFSTLFAMPFVIVLHPFVAMQNWYITCSVGTGLIYGYMFYDMTHYTLHNAANPANLPFFMKWMVRSKYFERLRTHHLIHHFATTGCKANFGISNMYIDSVLGTLQKEHN